MRSGNKTQVQNRRFQVVPTKAVVSNSYLHSFLASNEWASSKYPSVVYISLNGSPWSTSTYSPAVAMKN